MNKITVVMFVDNFVYLGLVNIQAFVLDSKCCLRPCGCNILIGLENPKPVRQLDLREEVPQKNAIQKKDSSSGSSC
jgi:hypothetical protein